MMARIANFSRGPIPKKGPALAKDDADKSPTHLAFVRTLPCVASGITSEVVAHHLRIGRFTMSKKTPDSATVPLNTVLHEGWPQSLHSVGEPQFWNALGIDPFALASLLWEHSGDYQRCHAEVMAARAAGEIRRRYGIKLFREKAA